MINSGDTAEQIVRMSLEGVDVAVRIAGTAAKEIALLLLAAMKSPEKNPEGRLKLKGRERLNSMLKSGKPLEIFSVRESDLKTFMQGAKQYGIVYCVLRSAKNSRDGLCDVMVKADDAPRISRLIERLGFATVDRARVESGAAVPAAERAAGAQGAEPEALDVGDTAPFFPSDPPTALPSEPTSGSRKRPEKAASSKKSTKEELREIAAAKKAKEAAGRSEIPAAEKPKNAPAATHKQPQRKPKKTKGNR